MNCVNLHLILRYRRVQVLVTGTCNVSVDQSLCLTNDGWTSLISNTLLFPMKISIHETGIDAQYVVTTSYDLTFSQLSKNLISNTKHVAQKSMKRDALEKREESQQKFRRPSPRRRLDNSCRHAVQCKARIIVASMLDRWDSNKVSMKKKKERKRKANGKQRV